MKLIFINLHLKFSFYSDTPLQRSENIPSFAECEEFLNDSELLNEVKDSALDKQLALMDRYDFMLNFEIQVEVFRTV